MSLPDRVAIAALPAGWAEAAGVNVAAGLGPEVTAVYYRDPNLVDLEEPENVHALVPLRRVTEDLMCCLPALRVVSVPGTGAWDYVDIPAATRRGVCVCNVRDYAGDAVAEFTIGLMVALSRRIVEADRSLRGGHWTPEAFVGAGLSGRTLGLVGCGSIGRRVAIIARAMGMDVLCATRSGATSAPVTVVPLDLLLRSVDIVSLHLPLDGDTRGLLDRTRIATMKPGASLINTARGALVDIDALQEALEDGRIAAAALDVFDPEPPPGALRLQSHPNVILTPHIAAATTEAQTTAVRECLANIRHFVSGHPRNLLNEEVVTRCPAPSSC
jgi:D-3-phosphoglycerate dehydrogenase